MKFDYTIKELEDLIKNPKTNKIQKFLFKRLLYLQKYKLKFDTKIYLSLLVAVPVALFMVFFVITQNLVFGLAFAVYGFLKVDEILLNMKTKKEMTLREEFKETLDLLINSLDSNMSMTNAIKELCLNTHISPYFQELYTNVYANLEIGMPMLEALEIFADDCIVSDARKMVDLLKIGNEVGNVNSAILKETTNSIRENLETQRKIRSSMSSSRILLKIFDITPVLMMVFFYKFMGDILTVYDTELKFKIILVGIIAIIFSGTFVSNKIANKVLD